MSSNVKSLRKYYLTAEEAAMVDRMRSSRKVSVAKARNIMVIGRLSREKMALRLGVSLRKFTDMAAREKIELPPPSKWTPDHDSIREMILSGAPIVEIARDYGVGQSAISYIAKKLDVLDQGASVRHAQMARTREMAVKMRRDGIGPGVIETTLGYSRNTIRRWCREVGLSHDK